MIQHFVDKQNELALEVILTMVRTCRLSSDDLEVLDSGYYSLITMSACLQIRDGEEASGHV